MNLTKHQGLINLVPSEFYLSQNYPNPFNEKTTIKLCVPYKTRVKVDVFDVEGILVRTLLDEEKEAGTYEVDLDSSSLPGAGLGGCEGIYVYQLRAGGYSATKKMVLLQKT